LDDIKRKFKSNTFEVGVDSPNPDLLNKELESKYELIKPSFKTIGENLKLNVKLKDNQNSEDLLKILNQNARVIHFKEVIPSANDIFINSIEND
jgi:ABC-2 type transport system ATP-binding protein